MNTAFLAALKNVQTATNDLFRSFAHVEHTNLMNADEIAALDHLADFANDVLALDIAKLDEWNLCGVPVVERAKAEILRDIAAGIVPATVRNFSELHDHVDANGYGGAFESDDHADESTARREAERVSDFWNRVQGDLDAWLQAGRPTKGDAQPKWTAEFDAGYAVPGEIIALVNAGKLVDVSWHNDVCPSFSPKQPGRAGEDRLSDDVVNDAVKIWIDHPDVGQRELGEGTKRFAVTVTDDAGDAESTLHTDALAELLAYLKQHHGI